MGIGDQLNALRGDVAGCRIAAFADLASGLVLYASADGRVPQERLDALCRRATSVLSGTAPAAAALLAAPVDRAVVPDGDGILVILRAPDEPDEALVFHCDRDIDLAAFTTRAARELATLGAAP
jgi:hypothetical protein